MDRRQFLLWLAPGGLAAGAVLQIVSPRPDRPAGSLAPITTGHPTFGELTWHPARGWWEFPYTPSGGRVVSVCLDPKDGERRPFLAAAEDLFRRAVAAEPRVFAAALPDIVREQDEEVWHPADQPRLSGRELRDRLAWVLLRIDGPVDRLSVTFTYDGAPLFGWHGLGAVTDGELRYRRLELVG